MVVAIQPTQPVVAGVEPFVWRQAVRLRLGGWYGLPVVVVQADPLVVLVERFI